MPKYVTRQRKTMLSYLRRHTDELLSAREIGEALEGEDVSLSSVYRNLSELEAEGKVRRSGRSTGNEVLYQYIDAEACRDCLHLNCRKCGRTFHMKNEGALRLMDVVAETEGFSLDKSETVLYGTCGDCLRQAEDREESEDEENH